MIDQSQRIVFFRWGRSFQRSKIFQIFRSSDGVYSVQVGRHLTAEQLVSHTMFERLSRGLFSTSIRNTYSTQMPSPMQLIAIWLGLKRPVSSRQWLTQNIDSLHEMAGSKKVLLHGSADRNYCTGCQRIL